jgi:cytidyltransferase-like protein
MWSIFLVIFCSLFGKVLDDKSVIEESKTIGYYIGSFDPIHIGHQFVVESSLDYVDYVLIYPHPDKDQYKSRSPRSVRNKMIASLYEHHPRVLITDYTPIELQNRLGHREVVGIIGSDVGTKKRYSSVFMRGIPLKNKHYNDSAGVIMALKATSFLVNLRSDESLPNGFSDLPKEFFGRPIRAYFVGIQSDCSSTRVRDGKRRGEDIDKLLSPEVSAIYKSL